MAETTNILRTKLYPPKAVNDNVHRVRLIEKLNNNYQKNALTLVSAPAGYGKSYLVSCWLNESNIPFGWVSLSEDDNDLRTFLEYLVAAVEKVSPEKLEKTSDLLQVAELPPVSVILNLLINELDEIDKEFVFVLDDYHLIKEKKIHDLIDGLLQYPPDNMLLCIITRKDPPLKIGSLRAYNRMNEIRMEDLSFKVQEIPVLYKNMIGLGISEETSERLLKRTEGWVTGLRLMAHTVKTIGQLENMLKKMKGDNRFVTEYLVEEVLSSQPEEYQKYLMKSSLLDRFCADVVEVLDIPKSTEKEKSVNGEEFIKWIEQTNLFVIPLDEEHKWFRYHHEFQRLLQQQLSKRRTRKEISTIHKKAGLWFDKNGFIKEAIKHLSTAGELELAADVLQKYRVKGLNNDQWRLLETLLNMIPSEVLEKRTELLLTNAWVTKQRFRLTEMIDSMVKVKELFGEIPEETILYGEWCFLMGWIKTFLEGDINGGLELLNKSIKLIPEKPANMIRSEAELQTGIVNQMAGHGDEAIEGFRKRLADTYPAKETLYERLQFGISTIYMLKGMLRDSYTEATPQNEDATRKNNHFLEAWSCWFLGTAALNLFDLEEAVKQFNRVIELRFEAYDRATIDSFTGLALSYQMLEQPQKADEILKLAQEYCSWSKDPNQQLILESGRTRVELLRGEISYAIEWERTLTAEPHFPSMVFFQENPHITACRVLLTEESPSSLQTAAEKLEVLKNGTVALNYNSQTIEILLLQVAVQQKIGNNKKALTLLNDTLVLTEQGGWIRPFIEIGNPIAELLEQLQNTIESTGYITEILKHINSQLEVKPSFIHDTNSGNLREPLTNREIEILSLLSKGLKNREIGDKIFLAQTTIKKHIYNIYQKFDVHSRIEVVTKARELGLIS